MQNKQVLVFLGVLGVIIIAGFWYQTRDTAMAPSDAPVAKESDDTVMVEEKNSVTEDKETVKDESVDAVVGDVKEFTVEGGHLRFNPSEIKVKEGDKVKVIFKNIEGTHDWKLEGYNVGTATIKEGTSETVEFTADKKGTFVYYCSVGSHRAMGMVGKLIVE